MKVHQFIKKNDKKIISHLVIESIFKEILGGIFWLIAFYGMLRDCNNKSIYHIIDPKYVEKNNFLFGISIAKIYCISSSFFGILITNINMYNIKKSPLYRENYISVINLIGVSISKGIVYGIFFPFSIIELIRNATHLCYECSKHFIPSWKYNHKFHF